MAGTSLTLITTEPDQTPRSAFFKFIGKISEFCYDSATGDALPTATRLIHIHVISNGSSNTQGAI